MRVQRLPTNWLRTALADIAHINPRTLRDQPADEDLVSFVRMASVEEETGRLNASTLRPWKEVSKGYTRFEEGDVLFAKITPCMENGKFAMANGLHSGRGAGSTEFHVLRPSSAINSKFLLLLLFRGDLRRAARMCMRGAAGQLRVPPEFLETLSIDLPPIAEQQRIVAEIEKQFTRLDDAIGGLKRVQANLKRYRASVLKTACEGRLVPTEAKIARKEKRSYEPASELLKRILVKRRAKWEADQLAKMKAAGKSPLNGEWKKKYKEPTQPDTSSLPKLPEGWTWATLDQLSGIQGGIQKQPKRAPKSNAYPYLRVANVYRGRLDLAQMELMELFGNELEKLRLKAGDLLIVEGNGSPAEIGRMAVWRGQIENCVHQNHIIRARLAEGAMPEFFAAYWNSVEGTAQVLNVASSTSGLYTLSVSKVGRISVPLAPVQEQLRIISVLEKCLSDIEATTSMVKTQLNRSISMRQSLLKRAFEGKLVAQDPSDEPASALLDRMRTERKELQATRPQRLAATAAKEL